MILNMEKLLKYLKMDVSFKDSMLMVSHKVQEGISGLIINFTKDSGFQV